jgi:hypothetical protein
VIKASERKRFGTEEATMNKRNVVLIGLVAGLLGTSTLVSAFEIDPRCAKMNDQIRCTCALQSSGWIAMGRNGKMHWYVGRPTTPNQRSIRNDAFDKCEFLQCGPTGNDCRF